MIDYLMAWYQLILDYAKPWPAAQAAIVTTSSVALAGGVGFALWKGPQRFLRFIQNQCMTHLSFSTASTNWSEYNAQQYIAFLRWFGKNKWFGWSRVVTLDGMSSKGAIGPGLGTHFFIFDRRFFFFNISEEAANTSNVAKYRIRISTIGRSKAPIYKLMEAFMEKDDRNDRLAVFENGDKDWNWISRMTKRDPSTVILSDKTRKELIEPLMKWNESREWYAKRGLNYKLTILLYGPPGTGKSSLAAALASMLNRDIHILKPNWNCSYNGLFQSARGGVVLMEDIDTYNVTRRRSSEQVNTALGVSKSAVIGALKGGVASGEVPVAGTSGPGQLENKAASADKEAFMSSIENLADLLNGLDGVLGLNDVIVIMTTNHPEKLDSALIRDERVDLRVEVPYLRDAEIRQYIELMFPGEQYVANEPFGPLPGATVQKQFKANPNSVQGFVGGLYDEAKRHLELVA